MATTVAAVIVTYNRKELLIQGIEAVLRQTRPVDCLFVIDNASTDGTLQRLTSEGYCHHPVIKYVQLAQNTGGAGGFHEGMKRAFEAGYTWLWLMDDDGYPEDHCLEKLLINQDQFDVIGAVVVPFDDQATLALKLRVLDENGFFVNRKYINTYQELCKYAQQNIYFGTANFFNGVLLHQRVPQQISYVLKELFIWGDEYEYSLRIKSNGFKVGTRIDAFYYHPASLTKFSQVKYFYYFRNLLYIYRSYGHIMYRLPWRWFFLIYTVFKCLGQTPSLSPRYLAQVLGAVGQAWQGNLIPYPVREREL